MLLMVFFSKAKQFCRWFLHQFAERKIIQGKECISATGNAAFTKLENETIVYVSTKTAAKMAVTRTVQGALICGADLGNFVNGVAGPVINETVDSLLDK